MKQWKPIPNYESIYKVSNDGEVMNAKTGRILYQAKTHKGYREVKLCDMSQKTFKVHRLVAAAFLDSVDGMDQVNHKNGIKDDNRLENLEWSNNSLNIKHAYDNGLFNPKRMKGHANYFSKVVIDYNTGVFYTIIELAMLLGMSRNRLGSMLKEGSFKSYSIV